MGAFILFNKKTDISETKIIDHFKVRGFEHAPIKFEFENYILLLFQKQSLQIKNYCFLDNNALFSVGTIIYKGLSYGDSLNSILYDFVNGEIDFSQVYGNFFVIFKRGTDLYFLHDPFSSYGVYYDEDQKIISSSFLAILNCSGKSYEMGTEAITETLLTGTLIGPDTLVKGIFRIENIVSSIGIIKRIKRNLNIEEPASKTVAVDFHLRKMKLFFLNMEKLVNEFGLSAGMTGGFDSRMLMALILNTYDEYHFYTHWRKNKNKDLSIAHNICRDLNIDLYSIEVKDPIDMTRDEFENNLRSACLFYDGNIRSEIYWTEVFNTLSYRKKIVSGKGVELNGMGGEQYRNAERRIWYQWNFKRWIKYEYLFRNSGRIIRNKEFEQLFIERIIYKIEKLLSERSIINFTHKNLLRFINEIYNPANRLVRNCAENQLIFSLSPFADSELSIPGYSLVKRKGWGYRFEMEMLQRINLRLASYTSTYGFSFAGKEPLKVKMITLLHELLPFRLYNSVYRHIKTRKKAEINETYLPYIQIVKELKLPLKLDSLINNSKTLPLVVSLGFFCEEYKSVIKK
jgi:hypothetical protein